MIGVLVIDDEKVIRDGLRRLIEKECPGFEVVAEAADGETALTLTESLRPQVAIVDLRLPILGGLDYMRFANQRPYPPQYVVLSGFADFDYARQAVGLGCAGYLLKPVKHDEFAKLMAKLREEIERAEQERAHVRVLTQKAEEQAHAEREKLLRGLTMGMTAVDELTLKSSGLECMTGEYFTAVFGRDNMSVLRKHMSPPEWEALSRRWQALPAAMQEQQAGKPCVFALLSERVMVGILPTRAFPPQTIVPQLEAMARWAGEALSLSISVGYSGPAAGVGSFSAQYEHCVYASGYRFYTEIGGVHAYDDQIQMDRLPDQYSEEKRLIEALDLGDGETALKTMDAMLDKTQQNHVRKSMVMLVFLKLYMEILNLMDKKGRFDVLDGVPSYDEYEEILSGFDLFSDMRQYIHEALEQVLQAIHTESQKGGRKLVRIAKRYVEEHTDKPIGVAEVAELTGLNPGYFSVMFKRATGENFINYVTRVKVEKAKQLLADPTCKVYEVCDMLGYEHSKYFSKIFKKSVGMTPSEYREGKIAHNADKEEQP